MIKTNGTMPHDTIPARRRVVISKAASRREMSALIVNEIIPAIHSLQHNDTVTQNVLKAVLQALEDITVRLNRIDPLPAVETPTTDTTPSSEKD